MRAARTSPLSSSQVALVQDSFARIAPVADSVAGEFYDRLFRAHPDVRRLFPKDMTGQREKLISTLAVVVRGLGDFAGVEKLARELGARHRAYKAEPAHYKAVGEALIEALAARLGPRWSRELREAWIAAYTALSNAMLDGAARKTGV